MKILIILLIVPAFLHAQKCKKSYDEFTKKVTIETGLDKIGNYKPGGLSNRYYLQGTISATDSTHYIMGLIPEFSDVQSFSENDVITLLFTTGETLDLHNGKYSLSNVKSGKMFSQGGGSRIFYNTLLFIIESEASAKIKVNTIKKIRFNAYDFDVTDGDYFKKAMACIDSGILYGK